VERPLIWNQETWLFRLEFTKTGPHFSLSSYFFNKNEETKIKRKKEIRKEEEKKEIKKKKRSGEIERNGEIDRGKEGQTE
jgi:hypothetical protein